MDFLAVEEEEFERWIAPHDVLALLPEHLGAEGKRLAALNQLKDGLIRAAASLVPRLHEKVAERWELHKRVWDEWGLHADDGEITALWDRGELRLNLATAGFFDPQVGRRVYGVRFDPEGVAKLIAAVAPRSRAAAIAALPDVIVEAPDLDDDGHWISPAKAVELLVGKLPTAADAREAIIHYSAAGMIRSGCKRRVAERLFGKSEATDGVDVDVAFWRAFEDSSNRVAENWAAAVFVATGVRDHIGPFGLATVRILGVEFCEEDVREAFDLEGSIAEVSAPTTRAGIALQKRRGPKPKVFWQPMMTEIGANISSGKLLASSLADVERAMADWLLEREYDAGESTIRIYARKVWASLDLKGR